MAIANDKDLLPILLDDTPLPRPLKEFQWIDFSEVARPYHGSRPFGEMTGLIAGAPAAIALLGAQWAQDKFYAGKRLLGPRPRELERSMAREIEAEILRHLESN